MDLGEPGKLCLVNGDFPVTYDELSLFLAAGEVQGIPARGQHQAGRGGLGPGVAPHHKPDLRGCPAQHFPFTLESQVFWALGVGLEEKLHRGRNRQVALQKQFAVPLPSAQIHNQLLQLLRDPELLGTLVQKIQHHERQSDGEAYDEDGKHDFFHSSTSFHTRYWTVFRQFLPNTEKDRSRRSFRLSKKGALLLQESTLLVNLRRQMWCRFDEKKGL